MTLTTYLIIQQIIMGAIMTLGLQLIFERAPREIKDKPTHTSSRIIGLALTIIPLASFLYFFTPLRNASQVYATAINLSAYCLTSTLIAWAFYVLLNTVNSKSIIRTHLVVGLLYPLPLWLGLSLGSDLIARHTLIASYTLFIVLIIIHFSTCAYFYTQAIKKSKDETSQSRLTELKLLKKTLHLYALMIPVSVSAPSFFDYPLWLGMIFVSMMIFGCMYIYLTIRKIVSHSISNTIHTVTITTNIEPAEQYHPADANPLGEEVKQNIEKQLRKWLESKKFLDTDVSIASTAKDVYTNRTYLSKYINAEYGHTFRSWLTQLRIQEAKELLTNSPELSINSIAKNVGFASVESFSHTFTRNENMPPSKWREEHTKK